MTVRDLTVRDVTVNVVIYCPMYLTVLPLRFNPQSNSSIPETMEDLELPLTRFHFRQFPSEDIPIGKSLESHSLITWFLETDTPSEVNK